MRTFELKSKLTCYGFLCGLSKNLLYSEHLLIKCKATFQPKVKHQRHTLQPHHLQIVFFCQTNTY